ncbi:MAG: glycosyltransferase family 39 protein [Candidatus Hydrogenedentes bacterium]|nr:glycosyltransferase family 39 protein [Candidatus Hydrogenedentota bacterium]
MSASTCRRREGRNRAWLALGLAVPFVALVLLVSPRGDFPLNDDWVYAKMVQALVDDGRFGTSPLANAFALTQTLYAAPLVELLGFSFTLLRLTTVFMGWVTVCFTAFTARELGLSNRNAVLAALTVFVNPLFINLSYTFMTDVPFCAFASISTFYFVRALRSPTTANVLCGTLFSIAAYYERQFGALIPLAFAAASVSHWRPLGPRRLARAAMALAVPWAIALAAARALPAPEIRVEAVASTASAGVRLFELVMTAPPLALFLGGIFVLPISSCIVIDTLARPTRDIGARIAILPIAMIVALTVWGPALYLLTFFGPHILQFPISPGVGPHLFASLDATRQEGATVPSGALAMVIGVLSCLSVGAAATVIAGTLFRRRAAQAPRMGAARFLFLLSLGLLVAPGFAMSGPYFDRYLLPAVPPIALLAAMGLSWRPRRAAAMCAAVVFGGLVCYSVIGLQDYMAWNTARWQVIDALRIRHGVHDNEIDGGFEFNGMYTSDEYIRRLQDGQTIARPKKWWVVGDAYIVLPLDHVPGRPEYEVVESAPYYSWIGSETRHMYAMKRAVPDTAPTR